MDWSEFDTKIDDKLMNEIQTLEAGGSVQGDYEEVPNGKYEVVPEKIEMKVSKNGNPMMVAWLRIVAGEQKNRLVFANFVMKSSFGIHNAKNFLKKLDEEADVKFESFSQFEILLAGISEEICCQVSYVLNYGQDKKGYKTYIIDDGPYEVPEDYEAPESK